MAVVERVGRGRGEAGGKGGYTLEEAVVVGWQWERTETLGLRKGEGTDEEESYDGRTGEEGEREKGQSQSQRDGRSGSQEPYKELRAYS